MSAMSDFEEEFHRSGGHKNMNARKLRDSENRESEDSASSLLWKRVGAKRSRELRQWLLGMWRLRGVERTAVCL